MAFKDLKVTVAKVEGPCSRMKQGTQYHIRNAKLETAQGNGLCIFALGSLLPVLAAAVIKNQEGEGILDILHEWQCPDPMAKVIFRIEEA